MKPDDKLADLCRKIVRLRDGMRCQWTGGPVFVTPVNVRWAHTAEVAHILPKTGGNALRYLLDNQLLLSAAAHDRAHADALTFQCWFREKYPDRWESILAARSRIIRHWELDDLIPIYERTYNELRQKEK